MDDTLLNRNRDRHRKQLEPDGRPWHPLSAKTLAGKRTKRRLYEYRDRPGSLHPQAAGNLLTLALGNEKTKWHPKGTKSKATNRTELPARPLLGFPKGDADAVKRLVQDHIEYLLAKKKERDFEGRLNAVYGRFNDGFFRYLRGIFSYFFTFFPFFYQNHPEIRNF